MKTKDLSAASVASDSPNTRQGQAQKYKLGPAERDEVNSLMESAQDDLESVLFQLVWQREHAQANVERLAEALKMLRISSQACFDDILATGSISHENGSFYRRDRESSKVALADYEKGKQQ